MISESYCLALFDKYCEGKVACDCTFENLSYDADSCKSHFAQGCEKQKDKMMAGLDAGTIVFEPENAQACLDYMTGRAALCSVFSFDLYLTPFACHSILLDSAPLGELCSVDASIHCANHQGQCSHLSADGYVCTPLPDVGDPCGLNHCIEGIACFEGTCCEVVQSGDPCPQGVACDPSAVCDASSVCGSPASQGNSCESAWQCQEGLACPDGHCVPGLPLGAACRESGECGGNRVCTGHCQRSFCSEVE